MHSGNRKRSLFVTTICLAIGSWSVSAQAPIDVEVLKLAKRGEMHKLIVGDFHVRYDQLLKVRQDRKAAHIGDSCFSVNDERSELGEF